MEHLFGMVIGGFIIASLGSLTEYLKENKKPLLKSVIRDFIIGAVMVLFLIQILPDSMATLLDYPTKLLAATTGGSIEPELQVGPPKF